MTNTTRQQQFAHNILRVVNWAPANTAVGPHLILTAASHTPATADVWLHFTKLLAAAFECSATFTQDRSADPLHLLGDILTQSTTAYLNAAAYDNYFNLNRFIDQFLRSYIPSDRQKAQWAGAHPFRIVRLARLSSRLNGAATAQQIMSIIADIARGELMAIHTAFTECCAATTAPPDMIDNPIMEQRTEAESLAGAPSIIHL